jgi:flagellar biogenesis protein FliO
VITPWTVFIRTSLVCGLLMAIVFGLAHKRIEPLPLDHSPLKFDANHSFDYMRQLSKKFPNRVTWGENRIKAGRWIKEELKKLGYQPKGQPFSEMIAGKQYTDLENIYAEKRGTTHPNEIIMAVAHYDIVDTTTEGAMDDASGVGIVLELARVFAQLPTDRTIIFLLTDSEEYGAFWGATSFAQSFDRVDQIVAATNFDFVSPDVQTKILTLCDGLKTGYTPLWLREIALNSLRSLNAVQVADMDGGMEFIERAMLIPPSDHGAFLAAGIPSFNWVGQTDNFAYVMSHYHHSNYDVVEAMRPESFASYGRGAERVIRTIDALPRMPNDYRNSSYWKISPQYYMPGWSVTLIHILAFIPFLTYSLTKFGRTLRKHRKKIVWEVRQSEAKSMSILFGSLLLGYVVILMLPALQIITQYETFPATQKSSLLYRPDFIAILGVIAAVISVYWIFKKTFSHPNDSEGYIEVRHAFHAASLAFIIILAFLKNSYLGVLLLLPPAYFWMGLSSRRRPEDRLLNGLLVLGGSITFVAITFVLTTVFHIGVSYWYLFLSAAYGLISAYSVVLFFMAITVMIRLFKAFVL